MRQTVVLKDAQRHLAKVEEYLDAGLTVDDPRVVRALRRAITNLELLSRGKAKP